MSTIALPTLFQPLRFLPEQFVSQRVSAAPFGGSEQAVDLLNDRWVFHITLPPGNNAKSAMLESFVGALRGQVNTCDLWHFARPVPQGTGRGTLTLNAAVAQGASSIQVQGVSPANGTFLQGDLLGVGGMLFMAAADCVALGGVVTFPITGRVRKALSSGAAVTWNKPTAPFRMLSTSWVGYGPALSEPITFEFGEKI